MKTNKEVIDYLKDYINTYEEQANWQEYSETTIINDILYGLGVALDDKYFAAQGFDKFKEKLRGHLA